MQKFDKKMLVPLLAAIALILKYILQVDIPDAAVDLAADLILGGITLVGYFLHMGDKPAEKTLILKEEVSTNEVAATAQPDEPTVFRSNK